MKNIAIHIVMTDFKDPIFHKETGIVIVVNNNYDSDNDYLFFILIFIFYII